MYALIPTCIFILLSSLISTCSLKMSLFWNEAWKVNENALDLENLAFDVRQELTASNHVTLKQLINKKSIVYGASKVKKGQSIFAAPKNSLINLYEVLKNGKQSPQKVILSRLMKNEYGKKVLEDVNLKSINSYDILLDLLIQKYQEKPFSCIEDLHKVKLIPEYQNLLDYLLMEPSSRENNHESSIDSLDSFLYFTPTEGLQKQRVDQFKLINVSHAPDPILKAIFGQQNLRYVKKCIEEIECQIVQEREKHTVYSRKFAMELEKKLNHLSSVNRGLSYQKGCWKDIEFSKTLILRLEGGVIKNKWIRI